MSADAVKPAVVANGTNGTNHMEDHHSNIIKEEENVEELQYLNTIRWKSTILK